MKVRLHIRITKSDEVKCTLHVVGTANAHFHITEDEAYEAFLSFSEGDELVLADYRGSRPNMVKDVEAAKIMFWNAGWFTNKAND